MTAWQDQPPQSRRQLRLNERGGVHDDSAHSQDSHVDVADSVDPSALEQATLEQPTMPQPVIEPPKDAFARPAWETAAESDPASGDEVPTSESPAAPSHQPRSRAEAAMASGRRSQHSFPHAVPAEPAVSPGAEPLNYFTQGRSQVPVYGGPSFGVNAVTPAPAEDLDAEQPESAVGGYRIRDFSPESRRNAFSSTAESATSERNVPAASADGHLDYHTQQGYSQPATDQLASEQPASEQPAPEQLQADRPVAAQPEVQHLPTEYPGHSQADLDPNAHAAASEAREPQTEHTMTRRELRAMRESAAAAAAQPIPLVPPVQPAAENPVSSAARSWSIDSADLPTSEQAEPPVRAAGRFPFTLSAAPLQNPVPSRDPASSQDPVPLRPPVAPAPQSSRQLSDAMAEFDALMARDSGAVPIPETRGEAATSTIFPLGASSDAGLVPSASEPGASEPSEPGADEFEADEFEADEFGANEPEADDVAENETERADSGGIGLFDSLLGDERAVEAQPVTAQSIGSQPVWPLAAEAPTRVPGPVEHPGTVADAGTTEQIRAAEASADAVGAGSAVSAGGVDPTDGADNADHHYVAPPGHWSRQAAGNDEAQADGIVALSRNIGATSGAVTANHLVISSVPTVNDLLQPFSPTGEIMITGTIDLPRSLGTTGAHPARYDHSDVDTLLEASDREDSNVDSAPVRAIRAVSTHTSSRGLIGTGKPPHSSRLPMILAVSTAAVAAVVVVLFVAGLVLHVF